MVEVNNVITIPTSIEGKFFRYWLDFLRPFHKLTDTEINVMACLLRHRHELSKVITDHDILNKVLFSEDIRKKIKEECGITQAYFQVIMTKLKKTKLVDNGRINPKFIPRIVEGASNFNLLLSFELQ